MRKTKGSLPQCQTARQTDIIIGNSGTRLGSSGTATQVPNWNTLTDESRKIRVHIDWKKTTIGINWGAIVGCDCRLPHPGGALKSLFNQSQIYWSFSLTFDRVICLLYSALPKIIDMDAVCSVAFIYSIDVPIILICRTIIKRFHERFVTQRFGIISGRPL